jgi:predicted RNase H-like HicB family nuclease
MTHYAAIIDDEDSKAVGVWFPDLPGCFSAGDTLDEAMSNAEEALVLWVEETAKSGGVVPMPRSLSELKKDPEIAAEMRDFMIALIPLRQTRRAAE